MSMILQPAKQKLSLAIRELTIGLKNKNAVTIGGQCAMPFVKTDGIIPHRPRIAIEIHFKHPDKYPSNLLSEWKEVIDNPVNAAKKAKEIGADIIAFRINGINENKSGADECIKTAKEIADSTNLPLCIIGLNNRGP